METKELPIELQNKIDELREKTRLCYMKKDFEGFLYWMNQQWNTIPNPKEEWEESFRKALIMISFYIEDDINFEKAQDWIEILEKLDSIQQQHPGEVSLMKGKFYFEMKRYEDAKKYFDIAWKDSEGHCFGDEDAKYYNFFKNPQKYISK